MDGAFAADYATARDKFLTAVRQAEGKVRSFVLEGYRGPRGETLATDVAWLGPPGSNVALIITSGTHGVEGYAGSALQISVCEALRDTAAPAIEMAVVLVHAINPYGFAHTRRVNERNVDLNRNFVDFDHPLRTGAAYARLHAMLVPPDWHGYGKREADARLAREIAEHGTRRFQQAVCEGQYAFADGLFYGGREPTWSNRVWRTVLGEIPASVVCVGHINVHTGLGPFAYGEILSTLPNDAPALELARDWYGDLGLQTHGARTSAATDVVGTMNRAVLTLAPRRRVCTVSLEFGTVGIDRMIDAVRADNWLHLHGEVSSPLGQDIKRELRDCFYPDDTSWRRAIIARGLEVFARARMKLQRCASTP